jgi:hypothetical protein
MKYLFSSTIAALLIGLSGCASAPDSDKERFDLITKDLEPGGTVYAVSTARHVQCTFEKVVKETESQIWDMPLPDHCKYFCQRLLSQFELTTRLLGIQELKGWGISSKRLPGKETFYRNKGRLLLPSDAKGVLWNLPGKNAALEKYFYNLPADTVAAGAFVLNTANLEALFEVEKDLLPLFSNICKLFLQLPVKEVLKNMEGTWRFVIACDERNEWGNLNVIHGALTVPDRNGKIFSALSAKLKFYSGIQVDLSKGSIKFSKNDKNGCIPFICKGKDSFTVYTTPLAVKRTSDGNSMPQKTAFLNTFIRLLPAAGAGAFYIRNTRLSLNSKAPFDIKEETPVWGVLKRDSNGFVLECLGKEDFNSYMLHSILAVPVKLMFDFVQMTEEAEKRATPPAVQRPRKQSPAPQKGDREAAVIKCSRQIALIGKAFLATADKTGKWPVAGIDGIRQMVADKKIDFRQLRCPRIRVENSDHTVLSYRNCHYLYFGKPAKDSPKTPVLMELPFLHKDYFTVFYADGSVDKIQLSGQRNVRRAVSFLHTHYTYEEEEFMRLMHLAGEFDKILER